MDVSKAEPVRRENRENWGNGAKYGSVDFLEFVTLDIYVLLFSVSVTRTIECISEIQIAKFNLYLYADVVTYVTFPKSDIDRSQKSYTVLTKSLVYKCMYHIQ